MSNAFGGVVNLTFIVVFLVVVSGFLAFSVSYNKAFRVKNKIISIIETKEGIDHDDGSAREEIKNYMSSIGFSYKKDWSAEGYDTCRDGFCYSKVPVSDAVPAEGIKAKVYYKVSTAVNIDLPVLGYYVPQMKLFQVSGTTSTFYER